MLFGSLVMHELKCSETHRILKIVDVHMSVESVQWSQFSSFVKYMEGISDFRYVC